MILLVAAHFLVAPVAPLVARRWGRAVFAVCAAPPLATTAWAVSRAEAVVGGEVLERTVRWAPALGLDVTLRLDAFALVMVGLVSGIGVLVFAYSGAYLASPRGLGRFAGTLVAFSGAMLGLVLADNLLVLYVFWELTSVTSYLLIGFEDEKGSARSAALQALLTTGAGGLAMLGGLVLLGQAAGTYRLSALLSDPPTGGAVAAALVLVLIGAFTKSAQAPFHAWLPGAMAAPTPVSAYLHAATMVKAGVYLIARFAPAFADVGIWRPVVVGVGVTTMILGGLRALRQTDLKLLLAYGTVSQLGFLTALFGAGVPDATRAGVILLVAHALFKGALFMVVGIVDHAAHTRDLRLLHGLGRPLAATAVVAAVATASMAGLPLLFGFVAKEAAFEALLHGEGLAAAALVGVVVGSVLTFAYGARFLWGAFATKAADELGAAPVDAREAHGASVAFLAAPALLAGASVVLGVVPGLLSDVVGAAGRALAPGLEPTRLAVWHGVNAPLMLSLTTVAGGTALFVGRRTVAWAMDRLPPVPSTDGAFGAGVVALNRLADRVTAVVQNGSLPVYLGVILLTALALPGSALLAGGAPSADAVLAESPLQAAVGAAIVAAALAVAVMRRRFAAVLLLGGIGYGVAVLYVIQGAPDLALTQLLVETLTLVVFVLVLRHLPDRFERRPWPLGQVARLGLSAAVGLFVAGFGLVASASRTADPVSGGYLDRAVPEAGGRNVVNVILVDFRGLDTLGEITVLTAAALGVLNLVAVRRRHRKERV